MSLIINLTPECQLYVGSLIDARSKEKINERNIKMVINCTYDLPNFFEKEDVKYLRVPLDDHPNAQIQQHFKPTLNWVLENIPFGGSILVHCAMGVSRSATIAIALIMQLSQLSRLNAQTMVEIKRTRILPNDGFSKHLDNLEQDQLQQLQQFEQQEEQKSSNSELQQQIKLLINHQFKTQFNYCYGCKSCGVILFKPEELVHGHLNSCFHVFVQSSGATILLEDGEMVCSSCQTQLGFKRTEVINCYCGSAVSQGFRIKKENLVRKLWDEETKEWR